MKRKEVPIHKAKRSQILGSLGEYQSNPAKKKSISSELTLRGATRRDRRRLAAQNAPAPAERIFPYDKPMRSRSPNWGQKRRINREQSARRKRLYISKGYEVIATVVADKLYP